MTVLYRIATAAHVRDLGGTGARLHGGRWNEPGTPILYASPTRSLATVEFLVHVALPLVPRGLRLATIEVPDDASSEDLDPAVLPRYRRRTPAPPRLAALGTLWARSGRSLLLRVPSAVIGCEFNVLVNPLHAGFGGVKLLRVEPWITDPRLTR